MLNNAFMAEKKTKKLLQCKTPQAPPFFSAKNGITFNFMRTRKINPISLRTAKTPQSFGRSECSRVNNPWLTISML